MENKDAEGKNVSQRKKKIILVAAILAVALCITAADAFIWYINSPFPTVVNLMQAVRNRDMEAMLDCIEPDKADGIRKMLTYFGVDPGELLEGMLPENMDMAQRDQLPEVKFSGYHRKGDRAYIEFGIVDRENDTVAMRKMNFCRIERKWYLMLSFS